MVYTKMGGSTTTNVMNYSLFGGSPNLKVETSTLAFNLIVKFITQENIYKFENISV